MQGISLNASTASTYLGRLFNDAALANKGLQIADGKIGLKGPEVDQLLTHVEKLPAAEKADALKVLDFFRDKFEISDAAAKKKLLDFVPKNPVPLEVPGRVRSVADAKSEAATTPPTVSAKEFKNSDKTIDAAKEAAGGSPQGDAMANEMRKARNQPFKDGDAKVSPEDGGRKAYVESQAKNPPPKDDPFAELAASPFFEDRLMAALARHSISFMNDLNKKMSTFDDPNRDNDIRGTMKGNVDELMKQAARISPEGKARVARQIVDFAKANPELVSAQAPEIKEFVELAAKSSAGASNKDDVLKSFPEPNDKVLAAMTKSDNEAVRGWAGVLRASQQAEALQEHLGANDIASMPEDKLRKLDGDIHDFASSLKGMKKMLPDDVAKGLPDVELKALPAEIDGTSRQVQFQTINMMMQQYQQIMQAMSEIMNKMNEMAMEPVRKMGR